ncbi:MAG: PAS domain S-box protein [Chloroflexi bacterium]|nr:PAS domain S-box protein [Chloroflexota bacterium]
MNEIQNRLLIDQPERFWPQMLRWALIAFAYWVAVRLGLLFVAQPEEIASVWPASGLALAVLLLHPKSQWTKLLAVIFVVNVAGNWSGGNTIAVSLGFALANSLEAFLGAWVMTYFCRSKITFESIREVMALFSVALIVNGVSALLGAAIPAIAYNVQFFKAWQLWWAADGLGIILLTPLIVSLFTSPTELRPITARRTLEAVFLLSILLSFAWLLFGRFTDPAHPLLRSYMIFPFVIWLAFRFRLHGMTGALLLFAAFAIGYTLQDIGIFAIGGKTLPEHLVSVQIFLSVITFSGLLLSALITERNHAEIVLQTSESNFRNLAENTPDGILIASSDGRHVYSNRHAVEILGYSSDEILLTKQKDLADSAAYPLLRQRLEDRIAGKPLPPTYETIIRRKDGSSFQAEITGSRTNWQGQINDLVFIRDITERKQAEQTLQKKESNLSALISNTKDRIWAVDAEYRLIINNPQFLGAIQETIKNSIGIGKSVLLEEIPQEVRERWRSYYDRALGGEIFSIESKMAFSDQDLYVEYSFHPIRNLDESISGVVVSGRDITERKQAEERTQTLMERWSIVYRAGEEIGASLDTEQVFRAVYHAVGQVMPSEDFLISLYDENRNLLWGDYIIENGIRVSSNSHQYENNKKVAPNPQLADQGLGGFIIHSGRSVLLNSPEQINASGIKFLPYGSGIPTSSVLAVPMQLKGKMIGIISAQSYQPGAYTLEDQELLEILASHAAIAIDNASLFERAQQEIVERVQAEEEVRQLNLTLEKRIKERTRELSDAQEQLVRHEKLSVLGQMASSVGHELRNPLGVITSAVYYLKLVQPNADEKIKQYLGIIEQEVHTSEKIITDLLDFSRIKSVDREAVAVSELVHQTLTRFPAPNSMDVTIEIPKDLPQVFVDTRQIVQVLGNIILNACQAMASPAADSASTDGVPKRGLLSLHASLQGDMINIVIKDDGIGIPMENIQKIFEPLFTTKAKGVGLGLPVSQKLAQANGGSIEVQSEAGKGSSFNVLLPIYKEAK